MTEDFIQENEDRELFRRIKQGSEEAFRVVYGKYHRILYAVALKMLLSLIHISEPTRPY